MMTPEFDPDSREDAVRKRNLIDALYRKYSQALRKFLFRQRLSREEVADIVQETYCRVHQSASVEDIRNPQAFLFQVANNVRRNTRRHLDFGIETDAYDIETLDVESNEPGPYRCCNSEQELAVVHAALEELAPVCREAFYMNRFENRTYTQIATELDLSVSMIEKHISHALAHLKRRLEGIAAADVRAIRLSK
jgi:RNA polymerase sigma factor (sigma-70 family)